MPIKFACPKCQSRLSAADDKVGVKFPCPKCGQRLQVPTAVPVADQLGEALLRAAHGCEEALRPLVAGTDEKERTRLWIEASFELVYFFLHMASRTAYAGLGSAKANALLTKLGDFVTASCIDGFFGHWPSHLKEGLRSDFYDNLNSAEQEYTSCRKVLDEPPDLMRALLLKEDSSALFTKLGRNVATRLGRNGDVPTMMEVVKVSLDAYNRMDLEELVLRAGRVAQ